ncbi:hypothetical protein [Fulvivirga kasyanovii]|uniref:Uncharacterized protein n=1 Tax=Fulvivirga kasyanovii TaxID=396812 RepID=A0ABW9RM45_9BACT|nr:hypothetical protein [Fulvivirga kasyanovii]MTI25199.1 hypothetical protein [Fulvivirga kasyanovii]
MFSSLFRQKNKRRNISVSEFLALNHVQLFIKGIRKVNASEDESKRSIEEWGRRKEQAIKNKDVELLGQLCDEIQQNYSHVVYVCHKIRRRQVKISARLKQDYFPDNG